MTRPPDVSRLFDLSLARIIYRPGGQLRGVRVFVVDGSSKGVAGVWLIHFIVRTIFTTWATRSD
jgi:hypothetical protein